MSSLNDEDFDYNSNDDAGWGDEDLDIMDDTTKILQLSRQNSMDREDNTCWKCTKCANINNVKLTIEKEDMKCCGCNETYYIPDNTKTIQCSKWNNHNDYLLRINVLKKIKIWICNQCTFENTNIGSQQCEICESKRNSFSVIQTKLITNDNIQIKQNTKVNQSDSDITINCNMNNRPTNIKWQCPHCKCNGVNIEKSQCNVCGCHQPKKFTNKSLAELISFGYIRQFIHSFNLNIPIAINKLCQLFYVDYDRFERNTVMIDFDDMPRSYSNGLVIKKPLKKFVCKGGGYICNLFGEKLLRDIKIYRWRIKLTLNEKLCDELDENDKKKEREKVKFYGVGIGIAGHLVRGSIFDGDEGPGTYRIKYGIHGNGTYKKYQQFCRGFMENDIITLEFDGDKRTLSYGINNDWFGVAYKNINPCDYRLGVCVKQRGVEIECVEFFER